MPIVLLVQENDVTYKVTLTKRASILGRSSKSHIKLTDPMVSGKHCAFILSSDGKATVKDLDSSNGTYLNGSKVGESHLMLDDEITIGEIKCWLDSSAMGPKEKKIHVRDSAKTKMKFINLAAEEKRKRKDVAVSKTGEEPPKSEDSTNTEAEFDPKTSIIKVDLDEISDAPGEPEESEDEFTRTQIAPELTRSQLAKEAIPKEKEVEPKEEVEPISKGNDRLAKKAKKLEKDSQKVEESQGSAVGAEMEFDQEETGQTKFIKVEKSKTQAKKSSKDIVKKTIKKKSAKKDDEDENILGKLKGIFKK